MKIFIFKGQRLLLLMDGDREALRAQVALGRVPMGAKQQEGDGKTPEGVYRICLIKEAGRHGQSLGISYPNSRDADVALDEGRIDPETHEAIHAANQENRRPPWGSPLGGEVFIHGGGATQDWTQGCIALADTDMARLFAFRDRIDEVEILP